MLQSILTAIVTGLLNFLKNWLTQEDREKLKSEAVANAEGKASVGPSLKVEEDIREVQAQVVKERGDEKETPDYGGWNSGN